MRIPKFYVLSGRMLAYFLVNFLQFAFLLLLGFYVYPFILGAELTLSTSSLLPLAGVLFASSFAATSYALFVSSLAKTQEQASALGAFGVVILSLLGGIMIPTLFMPDFMVQYVAVLSPLYWGLQAFAEAFQLHVDWRELTKSLLILFVFAAMFLGVSLKLFSWEKRQ